MLEVMALSAKAVFPLLFFLACGILLRKRNVIKEQAIESLNLVCFRFLLPVTLAEAVYTSELTLSDMTGPALFTAGCCIALFLLSWLIVPRFEKDTTRIPVISMGIFNTQYTVMGVSVAATLTGGNIETVAIVSAALAPLTSTLSAFIFEKYTGKATSWKQLLLNVVGNPVVVGSLAGFVLKFSGLRIPQWFMTGITARIVSMTMPVAMLMLGASFSFGSVRENLKAVIAAVSARLLLIPLIITPIAILFGFRGAGLVSIVLYAVTPQSVSTYSMTAAMGGDQDLARNILVCSSCASILTMFLWFTLVGRLVGFS